MKLCACSLPVTPGNPEKNAKAMIDFMTRTPADVYLFPALAVTGVTCGMLFAYPSFSERTDAALDLLCDYTAEHEVVIVTSTDSLGNLYLRNGSIGQKPEFEFEGKKVVVSSDGNAFGDLLLLDTAMAGSPCLGADLSEFCQKISQAKNCTVAVANPGFGEAVTDGVYYGFCGVYQNGRTLDTARMRTPEEISVLVDSDNPPAGWVSLRKEADLRVPYYGKNDRKKYLSELFDLQVQALYTRLKSSGLKKCALNISGGLDSTLALLVAASAMDLLGLPRENIHTCTLPCFGTGERTHTNALSLMRELKTHPVESDLRQAVTDHLHTVGHDAETQDTTYENAQARMRTAFLFDLANRENALVIGTGDLSEIALGFCTFAGDTLSHYNVNASVPKTLVRDLVLLLSDRYGGELGSVLKDVAETDVSPELKANQKTEDLLGPYLLHDFILYYYAKHHLEKNDLFQYLMATFDEYDETTITKALNVFFARYPAARFKRTSLGEGANLIGFTLPYIPTDTEM